MGLKDTWRTVAAQRIGEPVIAGLWLGSVGAAAKLARNTAVSAGIGQIAGGVGGAIAGGIGGVIGDSVADAVGDAVHKRRQAAQERSQPPSPQATALPFKGFAYLALGATRLGLFHFDGALRKDAISGMIFILNRANGMSLQLGRRGLFYGKLTLTIPGYLPTPLIAPSRFWKDLTTIAQELSKS